MKNIEESFSRSVFNTIKKVLTSKQRIGGVGRKPDRRRITATKKFRIPISKYKPHITEFSSKRKRKKKHK